MEKLKRKKDWEGRKVRSKREMTNGYVTMPKGTILTVYRNHGGLEIIADSCACCGMKAWFRKVAEHDVELLPADPGS